MCQLSKQYKQLQMLQEKALDLDKISLGDFLIPVRSIIRSQLYKDTALDKYLTQNQKEETESEVTAILNLILQSIINDTKITWALDDAMDIFLTTGSGQITGLALNMIICFECVLI